MPPEKNVQLKKQIEDNLSKSKSVVLTEYHGLDVPALQELRAQVKEVEGELLITKNTLIKLALKEARLELPQGQEDILTGPTMLLFAYNDPIAPLKVLADFAKEHELPTFKAGFLAQDFLSDEEVKQLSQLPGKEELLGKLVALINSPRVNLVFALRANLQKLVMVIKAIANGGEK